MGRFRGKGASHTTKPWTLHYRLSVDDFHFILATNFLVAVGRFVTFPFLAVYLAKSGGWSASRVEFVVGLGPLASMVFPLPGAQVIDRYGVAHVYALALLGAAVSLVGLAYLREFFLLCVLGAMSGLAWSMITTAQRTLLAEVAGERPLERVFGYSYWTFNLGAVLGPLTGAWLGGGERPLSFWLSSTVLLMIALLMLRIRHREHRGRPGIWKSSQEWFSYSSWFSVHLAWYLTATFFLFLAEAQLETNIAQYLARTLPNGIGLFAKLLVILTSTVLLLQPIASQFGHHVPPGIIGIVGILSYMAGPTLLVVFGYIREVWYVFAILLGFGEVLMVPVIQAGLARSVSRSWRATTFGASNLAGNAAYFLGPPLGGFLLERYGIATLLAVMAAFGTVGGLAAVVPHRDQIGSKNLRGGHGFASVGSTNGRDGKR